MGQIEIGPRRRSRRSRARLLLAALGLAALSLGGVGCGSTAPRRAAAGHANAASSLDAYAHLPMAFQPNRGQFSREVRWVAEAAGYAVGLTGHGALLSLHDRPGTSPVTIGVRFVGQALRSRLVAERRLPGQVNYLIGRDRTRWRTHLPTFGRVVAREVWPGIDVAFHGRGSRLEFDFALAAGADPARIGLAFRDARAVRIDRSGGIVVSVPGGRLRQLRPSAYQRVGGRTRPVRASYRLRRGRVSVVLGPHDPRLPLMIDPSLAYASYLGGSGGESCGKNVQPIGGTCVAVDSSGDVYITGTTDSRDFPTVHPVQGHNGGNTGNAFVAKIAADGRHLAYSTYLSGQGCCYVWNSSIAVDSHGAAYITGDTNQRDFPTTPGTLNPTGANQAMVYVSKLSPDGSRLEYSTYLRDSYGAGNAIAVDSTGHAYVGGNDAGSFPVPHAAAGQQGFVVKLNPSGSALDWGRSIGGSSNNESVYAIALDSTGHVYATGATASTDFPTTPGAFQRTDPGSGGATRAGFVVKLSATTGAVDYSTYLGGAAYDEGQAIAADSTGAAYVTGKTQSTNFPTTPGSYQRAHAPGLWDAFLTKLSPSGSAAEYSTYLGGRGTDSGEGVAVDAAGRAYVVGDTSSSDLPTTPDAVQRTPGGTFVIGLDPQGSGLVYGTYLGEGTAGRGVAIDGLGALYVGGNVGVGGSIPVTPEAFQPRYGGGSSDAFLVKLAPAPPPPVIGKRATLTAVSGTVLVELAGTKKFVDLAKSSSIPFGATVNASRGRVRVKAAKRGRGTRSGDFYSGQFRLTQDRSGIVQAALNASLSGCPRRAKAQAAVARPKKRRLFANTSGGYRTRGNYGSASVRGTSWLTEDRCDGTFFRVFKGSVRVTDLVRHRTLTVTAGHTYLARKRR